MDGGAVQVMYDSDGNRVAKAVTASGVTTTTYYLVDDLNPTGLPLFHVCRVRRQTSSISDSFNSLKRLIEDRQQGIANLHALGLAIDFQR